MFHEKGKYAHKRQVNQHFCRCVMFKILDMASNKQYQQNATKSSDCAHVKICDGRAFWPTKIDCLACSLRAEMESCQRTAMHRWRGEMEIASGDWRWKSLFALANFRHFRRCTFASDRTHPCNNCIFSSFALYSAIHRETCCNSMTTTSLFFHHIRRKANTNKWCIFFMRLRQKAETNHAENILTATSLNLITHH